MTLHIGKTVECSDCDKKFSRPSFLILHMREHVMFAIQKKFQSFQINLFFFIFNSREKNLMPVINVQIVTIKKVIWIGIWILIWE